MAKKEKQSALGKGLSSIFGAEVSDVEAFIGSIENGSIDAGQKQVEIDHSKIRPNPYQPRKNFDEKALKELAESIKEHGIFQPILLRKSVQGYEIIAGERRWRAAKLAGLKTVPSIVVEFNDTQMMEIALLENIQRENLNAIEEAMAYQNLIQRLGYTQEELAKRVGKSREYIANLMRLLKLPLPVQELVVKGKLTTGHVRPLVTLDDEDEMYDIALKIMDEKMSVRDVEKYIKTLGDKPTNKKKEKKKNPAYAYVESIMQQKLQTQVTVKPKQIIINYVDVDDMNRILDLIGCIEESEEL